MGRRPRSYAALLASAALCSGLLLTSCGGDEQPSPPPTGGGTVAAGDPTTAPPTSDPTDPSTSSTDPSQSPTSKSTTSKPTKTAKPAKSGTKGPEEAGAPGVPKAARQHTKKGAEAFVRYYNKQLNIAWSKPKAGLLNPLSLPGCKSCKGYEKQAKTGVESGEHLDGPGSQIRSVEITRGSRPNTVRATVREAIQDRNVLDAEGKAVGRVKSRTVYSVSEVRWTDAGWRMQSVKALE